MLMKYGWWSENVSINMPDDARVSFSEFLPKKLSISVAIHLDILMGNIICGWKLWKIITLKYSLTKLRFNVPSKLILKL